MYKKQKFITIILCFLMIFQLTACGGVSNSTTAICNFLSQQDDIRWDWNEVNVKDKSTVSKLLDGENIFYKDSEDIYHIVNIKRTDNNDWNRSIFNVQKTRTRYFEVAIYNNVTIGKSDNGLYVKGISEDTAKKYKIKNEQKVLFGSESNKWYNEK